MKEDRKTVLGFDIKIELTSQDESGYKQKIFRKLDFNEFYYLLENNPQSLLREIKELQDVLYIKPNMKNDPPLGAPVYI